MHIVRNPLQCIGDNTLRENSKGGERMLFTFCSTTTLRKMALVATLTRGVTMLTSTTKSIRPTASTVKWLTSLATNYVVGSSPLRYSTFFFFLSHFANR